MEQTPDRLYVACRSNRATPAKRRIHPKMRSLRNVYASNIVSFLAALFLFVGSINWTQCATQQRNPRGQSRSTDEEEIQILIKQLFDTGRLLSAGQLSYNRRELLGTGGFGSVFKGRLDGRAVAVKQMDFRGDTKRTLEDALHEVRMMTAVGEHPNMIKYIGYVLNHEAICIVTEFVPGETLVHFANRHREHFWGRGMLKRNSFLEICERLFETLSDLHAREIVHADLKPGNIIVRKLGFLLNSGLAVTIIDFGLAQATVSGVFESKSRPGSWEYLPPEYLSDSHSDTYSNKIDIFSAAVTLYEAYTGSHPFAHLYPEIVANESRFPYASHFDLLEAKDKTAVVIEAQKSLLTNAWQEVIPEDLRAIFVHSFKEDPERRFSSEQMLQLVRDIRSPDRVASGSEHAPNEEKNS